MRGVVKFLLTLILGVALIWLGFWWYAESRLQSAFTDWTRDRTAQGWKISYDSIQRGTSLLDAAVTINNLNLVLPPGPANAAVFSRITFDNVVLSPLITRLAAIPFGGKLNQLVLFARISGPLPPNLPAVLNQLSADSADLTAQQKQIIPLIHQWAAQGGTGNAGLNLDLGPSTAVAAGSLKFDANLQPNGTADLTANHLDQFTAALTNAYPMLQDDITRAEAQLSPYLGNTDQGGQILNLHLTYGKPGILINGQKVADMKPLDWNALENPLPPPIKAQGDGSGAASPGPANP